MAVEDKKTSYRIYLVAFTILVMAILVAVKLTNIQWVEDEYYRELAKERTVRNIEIPANRVNVYSAYGSLLTTSIPNYDIRFDALAPKAEDFKKYLKPLSDSLSVMLGRPSDYYYRELKKARTNKNRYYAIVKGLSFTEYLRIKSFPLFRLGPFK